MEDIMEMYEHVTIWGDANSFAVPSICEVRGHICRATPDIACAFRVRISTSRFAGSESHGIVEALDYCKAMISHPFEMILDSDLGVINVWFSNKLDAVRFFLSWG